MSPFVAVCALEIFGNPKGLAAESMQKLAAQNCKNCRFVHPGLDAASVLIKFSKQIKGSLILYFPFQIIGHR
jgi:hypothetical protein